MSIGFLIFFFPFPFFEAAAQIEQLKEQVGCKKTIADYGISEEDFLATLDQMSEDAFDDQCTGANPRYPLISELKEIYKACYYGTEYTGK